MAFLQIIFGRYLLLVGVRHVFALTHLNFSNSKSRKFITVIAHVPQRVTPVRASHIYVRTPLEVGASVMADGVRQLFSFNFQMCYKLTEILRLQSHLP